MNIKSCDCSDGNSAAGVDVHKSDENVENPESPEKIKTTTVAERILKSPLFWAAIVTMGAIALPIVLLTQPLSLPIIVITCAIAIGVLSGGSLLTLAHKKLLYEISLAYSIVRNKMSPDKWRWYDEILPANQKQGSLTLGAMPLKTKNHHKELKGYVFLAMVQEFELTTPTMFSDPLTLEDRRIMNPEVEPKHISTQDFQPVSAENLHEGVEWIKEQRNAGNVVYVHCKAGKSRSAAVIICYLLRTGVSKNIDQALRFVQGKRPQANIGESKRKEIENYYLKYCSQEDSSSE